MVIEFAKGLRQKLEQRKLTLQTTRPSSWDHCQKLWGGVDQLEHAISLIEEALKAYQEDDEDDDET